jgi:hypothetical protein
MKKLALKVTLGFAFVGYLVAIGFYFAPATWHPSPTLALAICPANFLTMISMTDPSFGGIAAVIGPLNAVLYGVVGLLTGVAVEGVRSRKSERGPS